jgi:hypothetical protein
MSIDMDEEAEVDGDEKLDRAPLCDESYSPLVKIDSCSAAAQVKQGEIIRPSINHKENDRQ